MDDTPAINDGADTSLRKTVSLLNKIEAKTGSTTITGPVTVSNEVEVKNDSGNPVPVNDAGGSLTVDGSVSVSNLPASYPVTDNGGSLTVDGTVGISGTVPVSGTFWQATQPVSDAGGSLTIDGSVSVSNFPATQAVSGSVTANAGTGTFAVSSTQLPTALVSDRLKVDGSGVTQPISGSISVSNFPATQAVTGTFWQATQPISGTVTANTGLSQPLTDTQLRATAVPVSGPLTDTQLRASAVPVSGTFWQATQPISGTVTATQATAANLNATVVGSGSFTAQQATAANLNATVVQGTATNLKTQAENYQGGSAVGSANPLQVTLANTGANSTNLNATVVQSTHANLKAQAQILDSSGNQLTYAATGTAGTPASDVVTVQGIASGTAVAIRPRHAAVSVVTGTTANTSSNSVLAQNTTRQYLLFQNLSDTDMNINFGAAASSSTMLIPKNGGGIVFETGFVPTDTVNLICAASSKKFYILHA